MQTQSKLDVNQCPIHECQWEKLFVDASCYGEKGSVFDAPCSAKTKKTMLHKPCIGGKETELDALCIGGKGNVLDAPCNSGIGKVFGCPGRKTCLR